MGVRGKIGKFLRLLAVLIGTRWLFAPAVAVILYGTGDPTANTTAPTGPFANSGWQFEGQFDGFLGTVIAPNYFITAKHIGGSVSDTFSFNGTNYTTTAVFPDPSSDLQIWRVSGTFPIGNDVSAVQSQTRQSVNSTNFRYDVNADGIIDGNDVSITQGQRGQPAKRVAGLQA